jgi:hypothetical protein
MDDQSTGSLLKLNSDETKAQLNKILQKPPQVTIWEKENQWGVFTVYKSTHSDSPSPFSDFQIHLREKSDFINKEQETKICFNYSFQGVQYFATGKISYDPNEDECTLSDLQNFYKYEKRETERLLSFPHKNIFIFVDLHIEHEAINSEFNNVISINRNKEELDSILKNINDTLKEKEFPEVPVHYTGLRVIDISATGLAVICNEKEKLAIDNAVEEFNSQENKGILHFENELIKDLHIKEVVYTLPYVDSRTPNISMFKIGMNFSEHSRLQELLDHSLSNDQEFLNCKKEFEDLLDE